MKIHTAHYRLHTTHCALKTYVYILNFILFTAHSAHQAAPWSFLIGPRALECLLVTTPTLGVQLEVKLGTQVKTGFFVWREIQNTIMFENERLGIYFLAQ